MWILLSVGFRDKFFRVCDDVSRPEVTQGSLLIYYFVNFNILQRKCFIKGTFVFGNKFIKRFIWAIYLEDMTKICVIQQFPEIEQIICCIKCCLFTLAGYGGTFFIMYFHYVIYNV